MTAQPTIGLALIARDEEMHLPRLLASITGAFDQVALLDTGSKDRTVEVFEAWAEKENLPLGCKIDRFEWCDDFAAARNAADSLLDTEWLAWADADDEIVGAATLRKLVESETATDVGTFVFDYAYHRELEPGETGGLIRKPRLVRRGAGRWAGRVNEARVSYPLEIALVSPRAVLWKHRDPESLSRSGSSYRRNIRIARAWVADEPESPRAHAEVAFEEFVRGDRSSAIEALESYLRLDSVRAELGGDGMARARWALDGLKLGKVAVGLGRRQDLDHPLLWIALGRTQAHWDYTCATARTQNRPYVVALQGEESTEC